MKYDDSTWHTDGDFPADLPSEAGATHIGMFMAWALAQNLGSEDRADYRADVMAQRGTPGRLLLDHCDGEIIDEDLNDLGNGFAARYYDVGDNLYYKDLEANRRPADLPHGRQLRDLAAPRAQADGATCRLHAGRLKAHVIRLRRPGP